MIHIKGYISLKEYKIDEDGTVKNGPLYDYQGTKYQVKRIELEVRTMPLTEPLTGEFDIWLEKGK